MPSAAARGSLVVRDVVLKNTRCAGCHREIAREAAASEHTGSHDALFRRALAREPEPEFCEGCHAPEAFRDGLRAPRASQRWALGVTCTSCHPGVELGAYGHALPVLRDELSTGCAACHEFDFPGPRQTPEKMQLTVSEHSGSPYASVTCQDCHMPWVDDERGRHRSHAFREARSQELLSRALEVQVTRRCSSVTLSLESKAVGHRFPTGDLFRRLLVEAEVLGPDYVVLASKERVLARHFADVPTAEGGVERRALADDRLEPGRALVIELELGAPARARSIEWRISYQRVFSMNSEYETAATLESSLELKSGSLEPSEEVSPCL